MLLEIGSSIKRIRVFNKLIKISTEQINDDKQTSSEIWQQINDENWMSDTDSYLELYENLSDSDEEICDSTNDKRDEINDDTIDDHDTVEEEENSLMDEEKRKESIPKSSLAEWVKECNISRCHTSIFSEDCGLSFLSQDIQNLLKQ